MPTGPEVPSEDPSDEPTTPDEPDVPEEPESPDEPTDPDTPGTSDPTFVLRTDAVVGDTVSLVVPGYGGFDDPEATVTMEIVSIHGDLMDLNLTSVEGDGDPYGELMEDIPLEYFPVAYLLIVASPDPGPTGDPVLVGQDSVDTIHGTMVCDHYRIGGMIDLWYYPGTEFAALMMLEGVPCHYYIDSTLLSPA